MSLLFSQLGLATANAAGQFATASINAKLQKSVQAYTNTINALGAAQANNATTLNEIAARDATDTQREVNQIQALKQESSADVSSAAAGVGGNTTELITRDLEASAARANKVRLDTLENQYIAYGQERRNTAVAAATNRDVSVIPRPNLGSALLGLTTQAVGIYDSHQTPGDTIAARLSGTNGVQIRR